MKVSRKIRRAYRAARYAALSLLLFGCGPSVSLPSGTTSTGAAGPSTSPSAEDSGTEDPGSGSDDASTDTDEPRPPPPDDSCPEDESTRCGSTCTSLAVDAANCGECGRGCVGGTCFLGECQPSLSETCGKRSDAPITCAEICAAEGRTCAPEDNGKAKGSIAEFEDCSGEQNGFSTPCDEPVNWDHALIGLHLKAAQGIQCNCSPVIEEPE